MLQLKSEVKELFNKAGLGEFTVGRNRLNHLSIVGPCGESIVEITDFIDFTGHNTITENKNNYWDSSHLRKEFTEIVMAKIFNDRSIKVPDDFGILVTKANISKHLEYVKSQIKNYDLGKALE